jgi:hypothetical protein
VEKPKKDYIANLDVDKIEIPDSFDLFSFAKNDGVKKEEPKEEENAAKSDDEDNLFDDFEDEVIETPEQIRKRERIERLIAKQQSFRLEKIDEDEEEAMLYSVAANVEEKIEDEEEDEEEFVDA